MHVRVYLLIASVAVATAPAMSVPIDYTFDATGGSVELVVPILGSWTSGLDGSFAITLDDEDGQIGPPDTALLLDADLFNTDDMVQVAYPDTTFAIEAGDARFLDVTQAAPGVLGAGGEVTVEASLYADVTMVVSGGLNTTVEPQSWADQPADVSMSLLTSGPEDEVLTAELDGAFTWTILMGTQGGGLIPVPLEVTIHVEGTAHVVPDPTFLGPIALGLGGGGA